MANSKVRMVIHAFLASGSVLMAGAQEGSFYLRTGAGAAFVEDLEEELSGFGPSEEYTFSLKPGVRLDVAPGYQVLENLAVEFNTGFIWNSFDEIEGPAGSLDLEGDFLQVPLLVNAVGRFPLRGGFTPFVGGGGGGVYQYINIDEVGGTDVDDSGDDIWPAFQVFGGFEFDLGDNLSVGAVYKYMYVFSSEDEFTPGLGNLETDDTQTHSLSVLFKLKY